MGERCRWNGSITRDVQRGEIHQHEQGKLWGLRMSATSSSATPASLTVNYKAALETNSVMLAYFELEIYTRHQSNFNAFAPKSDQFKICPTASP